MLLCALNTFTAQGEGQQKASDASWTETPIFHVYCQQLSEGDIQPPDIVWCPTVPISQPKEVFKAQVFTQIPCLKSYFPHLLYPLIPTSSSHDRYFLCSGVHQLWDAAPWFYTVPYPLLLWLSFFRKTRVTSRASLSLSSKFPEVLHFRSIQSVRSIWKSRLLVLKVCSQFTAWSNTGA